MLEPRRSVMAECKHGLKTGCAYCHAAPPAKGAPARGASRRPSRSSRLSEQMNDRMTSLKKRLREIRGE
jgi:hypothetical protein